ncbi:MAG TPA: hypothetical protein VFU00_11940 [Gemmatimonadales bacterium]|nr:hypothetical protein [Gemmatimonadales bacterium]
MSFHPLARLVVAALPAVALIACADSSPVSPSADSDQAERTALRTQAVLGQYDIEFSSSGSELILIAHVRNAEGGAPGGGAVTFQYCSYKGLPSNDITQPDEAPSSACADGSASWANLLRMNVDAAGDAAMNFGVVQVVNTIGFRFKYSGKRNGVASATSLPEDWTR